MNCDKITNAIKNIHEKYLLLQADLPTAKGEKFRDLFRLKNEIVELLYINPATQFFKILEDQETFDKIAAINKAYPMSSEEDRRQQIQPLFKKLSDNYILDSNIYRHFVKTYESKIIPKILAVNKVEGHLADVDFVFNDLNSIFLNLYMREDTDLTLDFEFDPHKVSLNSGFLQYIERGTIRVKHTMEDVGRGLNGATIYANDLSSGGGERMESGIIKIKNGGITVGESMRGGKIYCENADSYLAVSLRGGLIMAEKSGEYPGQTMQGGFVYIHEVNATTEIARSATGGYCIVDVQREEKDRNKIINPAVYHHWGKDEYENQGRIVREVRTLLDISGFRQMGVGAISVDGSVVKELAEKQHFNITNGLHDGLIIIKNYETGWLGLGMSGGMVIIESTDLSVEEVKKNIITDPRDRKGGYILMRVPIPGKPGETHLIDLEDVTKEGGK